MVYRIKGNGTNIPPLKSELVRKIEGITDFQIVINLKNGDELPTIKIYQENIFYKYGE